MTLPNLDLSALRGRRRFEDSGRGLLRPLWYDIASRKHCFTQTGEDDRSDRGTQSRLYGFEEQITVLVFYLRIRFSNLPQQSDLRLSGTPSGQGAGGGAQTSDRRVLADLRANLLATVPPSSLKSQLTKFKTIEIVRSLCFCGDTKMVISN
ncbi:hypothetical protein PoB_004625600 [Plakobranchus ocellatus]|uniref:Uncharacterized protein n=1 Tax=Plakobranchus ocellatus TaxID=259542 RepID=A0AAV4B8Q8_9GAST|nr:hypothetical protein PoB_004625600 [Plakobranchus ocellatus]